MSLKENVVTRYFIESREELAKVVWPTREQVLTHSLLVIGISLGLGAYFGLLDFIFSRGLGALLNFAH